MSSVLCTICARGGSKSVVDKNIRLLHGIPLFAHSLHHAQQSSIFSHIVFSSDSHKYLDLASSYDFSGIFQRSANLSHDKSGKVPVIIDALLQSECFFNCKYDYIFDLDCTSPLRNVNDILKCFSAIQEPSVSNVITASPSRRSPYFNLIERDPVNGKIKLSKTSSTSILRRQDSPECFDMNASIYAWKRECLLNFTSLFLDSTFLHVMPEERSFDIDNELDFRIVEFLMSHN